MDKSNLKSLWLTKQNVNFVNGLVTNILFMLIFETKILVITLRL